MFLQINCLGIKIVRVTHLKFPSQAGEERSHSTTWGRAGRPKGGPPITCKCKVKRCPVADCRTCSKCQCEHDGVPIWEKMGRRAGKPRDSSVQCACHASICGSCGGCGGEIEVLVLVGCKLLVGRRISMTQMRGCLWCMEEKPWWRLTQLSR